MRRSDAVRIVQLLAAGFPHEALEPETVALWTHELGVLENAGAAADAAMTIVRAGDKFPTLRQFRVTYRQALERHSAPALEESSEREPMPVDAATWIARLRAAESLGPRREREIPTSDSIRARPVWDRAQRRHRGEPLLLPTEAEKHDAIMVLRDYRQDWPRELVLESERIVIEGSQ